VSLPFLTCNGLLTTDDGRTGSVSQTARTISSALRVFNSNGR
jgi:hypothetical protein